MIKITNFFNPSTLLWWAAVLLIAVGLGYNVYEDYSGRLEIETPDQIEYPGFYPVEVVEGAKIVSPYADGEAVWRDYNLMLPSCYGATYTMTSGIDDMFDGGLSFEEYLQLHDLGWRYSYQYETLVFEEEDEEGCGYVVLPSITSNEAKIELMPQWQKSVVEPGIEVIRRTTPSVGVLKGLSCFYFTLSLDDLIFNGLTRADVLALKELGWEYSYFYDTLTIREDKTYE